jgi:hypothetical protein
LLWTSAASLMLLFAYAASSRLRQPRAVSIVWSRCHAASYSRMPSSLVSIVDQVAVPRGQHITCVVRTQRAATIESSLAPLAQDQSWQSHCPEGLRLADAMWMCRSCREDRSSGPDGLDACAKVRPCVG